MDIEDPSVLKASEFEAMEQIIDRLRKLEHREIMLQIALWRGEIECNGWHRKLRSQQDDGPTNKAAPIVSHLHVGWLEMRCY